MSLRLPLALAAALYLFLVVALAATPAYAHASLVGSNPKDGATLDAEPAEVSVEFNEDVSTPAQLEVTAPDGSSLAKGEPTVDGTTVTQTLDTSGYAGAYTMAYRVVSADGHPVSGEITYEVSSGEKAEQEATTDEESFAKRHQTHLILGGVAVIVAAGLLAWPWIRRRV